jgi:hypothetical protein
MGRERGGLKAMSFEQMISVALCTAEDSTSPVEKDEPMAWLANVLVRFAEAEQILGTLSIAMGLPITNGSLGSLQAVKIRLERSEDRSCKMLANRIQRWSGNRPFRHLLAHATMRILKDETGVRLVATRHLPRDIADVTPDRLWTDSERRVLLQEITKDGRSICDHTKNILNNPALLAKLKS